MNVSCEADNEDGNKLQTAKQQTSFGTRDYRYKFWQPDPAHVIMCTEHVMILLLTGTAGYLQKHNKAQTLFLQEKYIRMMFK